MVSTSRWLVGSSRIARLGRDTSSRARATRRRSPPLMVPGRAIGIGHRPGARAPRRPRAPSPSRRGARSRPRPRPAPPGSHRRLRAAGQPLGAGVPSVAEPPASRHRPSSTTWRAVRAGSREGTCSSTPTVAPRRTTTSPASGSSRPASRRARVLLPEPLRPTSPARSPSSRETETSSSTCRIPKDRLRCRAVSTTMPAGRVAGPPPAAAGSCYPGRRCSLVPSARPRS